MRLTSIQHQNLLNIRALVLLVPTEHFDGKKFAPASRYHEGCAIHHAFHQGKLPPELTKNPSNMFHESNRETFDKHFGVGSHILFLHSSADRDKFIKELDEFINTHGVYETVEHTLSNGDVLTVTELGNGFYNVVRTTTSTMTLAEIFALIT